VAAAKFRESCLAAVCAASGILILQAVQLAARWPTCCLLAHGRPMGPTGVNGLAAGGGPAYWAQSGDLAEAKQIWYLKLGAITTQSSLSLPTHHAYIQTHPPLGLCNGPTYVALALWPNSPPCKWSGVLDCCIALYYWFIRCGSGLSGECLTDHGHMWIGIDISSSMLGDVLALVDKLLI